MTKKLRRTSKAALARARARGARIPRSRGVHYDKRADAIVVDMKDGAFVGIPRTALRGPLRRATPKQLGRVEIEGDGTYLFWPDLEDGLDIAYVLERFVGIRSA